MYRAPSRAGRRRASSPSSRSCYGRCDCRGRIPCSRWGPAAATKQLCSGAWLGRRRLGGVLRPCAVRRRGASSCIAAVQRRAHRSAGRGRSLVAPLGRGGDEVVERFVRQGGRSSAGTLQAEDTLNRGWRVMSLPPPHHERRAARSACRRARRGSGRHHLGVGHGGALPGLVGMPGPPWSHRAGRSRRPPPRRWPRPSRTRWPLAWHTPSRTPRPRSSPPGSSHPRPPARYRGPLGRKGSIERCTRSTGRLTSLGERGVGLRWTADNKARSRRRTYCSHRSGDFRPWDRGPPSREPRERRHGPQEHPPPRRKGTT